MIELNYKLADDFLKENLSKKLNIKNLENLAIEKIAGDASFRSYYRITVEKNNFILMFAPPTHEELKPFVNVDNFLISNGFNAPKIYAIDQENGFLLLEDFGDNTFTRILAKDVVNEFNYYKNACDVLLKLHKIKPDSTLQNYNNQVLFREVSLFIEWYLKLKNKFISQHQKADFKHLWFALFDSLSNDKKVVVLRDYHADNLMIINNKNNYNSIGLLDFQDALIGLPAYDLISLLDDIRRDISPNNRQMLYEYFVKNCQQNSQIFLQDCEILSLQRNIKILGIFARLVMRDNKAKYLEYIPRVKYFVELRLNSQNKIFNDMNKFLNYFL
jgi:aminoglycoside/choline kinase family phosphotransferase